MKKEGSNTGAGVGLEDAPADIANKNTSKAKNVSEKTEPVPGGVLFATKTRSKKVFSPNVDARVQVLRENLTESGNRRNVLAPNFAPTYDAFAGLDTKEDRAEMCEALSDLKEDARQKTYTPLAIAKMHEVLTTLGDNRTLILEPNSTLVVDAFASLPNVADRRSFTELLTHMQKLASQYKKKNPVGTVSAKENKSENSETVHVRVRDDEKGGLEEKFLDNSLRAQALRRAYGNKKTVPPTAVRPLETEKKTTVPTSKAIPRARPAKPIRARTHIVMAPMFTRDNSPKSEPLVASNPSQAVPKGVTKKSNIPAPEMTPQKPPVTPVTLGRRAIEALARRSPMHISRISKRETVEQKTPNISPKVYAQAILDRHYALLKEIEKERNLIMAELRQVTKGKAGFLERGLNFTLRFFGKEENIPKEVEQNESAVREAQARAYAADEKLTAANAQYINLETIIKTKLLPEMLEGEEKIKKLERNRTNYLRRASTTTTNDFRLNQMNEEIATVRNTLRTLRERLSVLDVNIPTKDRAA